MKIGVESPLTDDAEILLAGSEAALRAVYSVDECFTFTAAELAKPGITFYVARDADGQPLGCVASCNYGDYAEVKRLFVAEAGRGQGTAKALMARLEADAVVQGATYVKLETGEKLAAAVALYTRLGYAVCGPFGDYPEHPASLFMEKPL